MQADFIGTIEGEDDDISLSLYQLGEDDYRIWLKVGVALVELKENQIDNILFYLKEMKDAISLERKNV